MEFRRGLFRSVRRSAAKRVSRREPICGPAVATWADATPAPLGTNQPEGSYSGEDGIDRWVSDEDEEADEEEHHGQRHLLGLGLGFGLLRSHGVVADRLGLGGQRRPPAGAPGRSAERREGKAWGRKGRSR